MNILQTATCYYPSVGGAQLHWFTIAKMLQARGHRVSAVTQWKDQHDRFLLDSTLLAPWGDDTYDAEGIPVYRFQPGLGARCWMAPLLPFCLPFPEIGYPPLSAYFAHRFRALNEPIDLVHNIRIGREHYSWASYKLARERGVPFFITPNYSPRMHSRFGRVVMRHFFRLLRRADGVFVFTPDERNVMIELGVAPDRIHTIGVGPLLAESYDPDAFRASHGIRRNMVLFLGQKFPYKGFDTLIKAAPKVWAKHPDTSFVFIGPHYAGSREKILSLKDDRIVDLPAAGVFDPLKASALAAADVFALPSRQEGIGGVYIEAWAMGKPVIACDIPFLVIEDGKDGFLIPQTAEAAADRIVRLLDNPDEARAMGARGLVKVREQYNWDRISAQVEETYRNAVSR